MALIKSKLVQIINEQNPHLYQRDVERLLKVIFDEITNSLAQKKELNLEASGPSVFRKDGRG